MTKRFGGLWRSTTCTFDVEKGSVVGLIGPNGAGKTTVFNLHHRQLHAGRGPHLF
jgi:branched-chain amino acid transport system ATP-binding protein